MPCRGENTQLRLPWRLYASAEKAQKVIERRPGCGSVASRLYRDTALARASFAELCRKVREATTAATALFDCAVASRSENIGSVLCEEPGRLPPFTVVTVASAPGESGLMVARKTPQPGLMHSPLLLPVALGGRLPVRGRAGKLLASLAPFAISWQAALLLLPLLLSC